MAPVSDTLVGVAAIAALVVPSAWVGGDVDIEQPYVEE